MKNKKAFTLMELLVVISIIALLMAILMPTLNKAREMGKRAVCLSNLRQLTLAWSMYAQNNDDKLVKTMTTRVQETSSSPRKFDWLFDVYRPEPSWVGWWFGDYGDIEAREATIKIGLIYPYCENLKMFACPTAKRKTEVITYTPSAAMNSLDLYHSIFKGYTFKKLTNIKRAGERMVFLDEGEADQDSFMLWLEDEAWWDPIPVRHGNGTTLSFADGHAEYWKWKDKRSIEYTEFPPLAGEHVQIGNPDITKMQKAVWGKTTASF